MKKTIITLIALILGCTATMGQNPNCMGLKNPTNFMQTGGSANSQWKGYIGHKNSAVCTPAGMSWNGAPTEIAATQLASQSSQSTAYECFSLPTSVDINGQLDGDKRFVIKGQGYDPFTGNNLPYTPPGDTSFHTSIRLGNYCDNAEAEMLTYEFDVNANNTLLTIWFAMSLENIRHDVPSNPEFAIMVEKQVGNNWVPLAGGDTLFYSQSTPASGQPQAPLLNGASTPGQGNLYLPWNKVIINLQKWNQLYQRIRIKIYAGDCSASGHYGCAYIAGDCQPMRLSANGCSAGETDQVAEIAAPKGAISYEWFRSKTGVLSSPEREDDDSYIPINGNGANTDTLRVIVDNYIDLSNPNPQLRDTLDQNTFMCKMTTKMNPNRPIVSKLYADVGNKKPRFDVDTLLACDAYITLRDKSFTPFVVVQDSDIVDTSLTRWYFYHSANPNPAFLVDSAVGGTVTHHYPEANTWCVRVRSSAVDTTCWNEKTVQVRTIKAPEPALELSRDNICKGDIIALYDRTNAQIEYREWIIHRPDGDTVIVPPASACQVSFDTTTRITLRTRTNDYYKADTNGDGTLDKVYCFAVLDTVVHVGKFPVLTVTGDTIVCDGDRSDVYVHADLDGCRYDWYPVMGGGSPVQENSDHLTTTLNQDKRFYVKVTSPNGCVSWDSIDLTLVNPTLDVSRDKICVGETVTLWAGKAAYYEWNCNPFDMSFDGQQGHDTIVVSPTETTTYSVIGHGTNGCGATARTKTITVYPYPIMHVELTPDFIDSENPSVQFADLSENGATSLWNFGNGNTSTTRTVVFTFPDLSQDSVLVSLVTGNPLGCTSDTSFYVPVGIFAVWFPNAFTPHLETNRIFKPFTANELNDYSLYIYDRGGAMVFQTNNPEDGWDGTYKGKICDNGAYVYIARYRRSGVNRLMTQKGTVTLIR